MSRKIKATILFIAAMLLVLAATDVEADNDRPYRVFVPMVARDVYFPGINEVQVSEEIDAGLWLAQSDNACIIGMYTWDAESGTWFHRFPEWRRAFPGMWDEIQTMLPGTTYFVYCVTSESSGAASWLTPR